MTQISLFELFDEYITELSKKNPSDRIQNVKEEFESSSNYLFGDNFESFTIGIVVDANAAISTIQRYVKNKPSILFHLGKNPIFSLYAPNELKNEVLKYIQSDKIQKKSKKKWLEGLQSFEKIIKFKNNKDVKIKKCAIDIIGKKDLKDVPYVESYINQKAYAILTSDKHFQHNDIRVFSIDDLVDVTSIVQKGVLSHHIMNDSIPKGLKFLIGIILTLFKKIFYAFKRIFKIIKSKISAVYSNIIKRIEKQPNWQKIIIIGIIIIGLSIAISFESIRKKILPVLSSLINSVGIHINKIFLFLKKIIHSLIDFISYIMPHTTIIIEPMNMLLNNIENMEMKFKDMVIENTIV